VMVVLSGSSNLPGGPRRFVGEVHKDEKRPSLFHHHDR
jgi:hypothetical protein